MLDVTVHFICPKCKTLITKAFLPIGDIVYNPLAYCKICDKSYEVTNSIYDINQEYIQTQNNKKLAVGLIDQIIEMEKINDFHYQNMVNQLGHVPACGKSAILFHLATLKELVEKI